MNEKEKILYNDILKLLPTNPKIQKVTKENEDSLRKITDKSLDLVWIEAGKSYPIISAIINEWKNKIKPRGAIGGNDFDAVSTKTAIKDIFTKEVACNNNVWYYRQKAPVYDCFLFFNEVELLDLRLHELYNTVTKFIVVESTKTFMGVDKPLNFEKYKKRFEKWAPKIEYKVIDEFPSHYFVWDLERYQRNYIDKVLYKMCNSDDTVILSDADEIASRQAILTYIGDGPYKLGCKLYYYYLNGFINKECSLSSIFSYKDLYSDVIDDYIRFPDSPSMPNAGWHFSYLGGPEKISYKLKSFSHTECNTPEINNETHIKNCMETGDNLFGRDTENITYIPIDNTFPEHIQKNQNYFKTMGFIKDVNTN